MATKPLLLLTNDDGIDAPGLLALEAALQSDWDVHVVAPSSVMSMCGHRVTTDEPLRVTSKAPHRHAVDGTPADCVRLALTALLPRSPQWVLSGINHGGNLGADIFISGTVAAVREAAFLGAKGIAFSHFKKRDRDFDWEWAARCALHAMDQLISLPLEAKAYWNVNLPHIAPTPTLPKAVTCAPSKEPLPVSFRESHAEGERAFHYDGVYQDRQHEPDSDIAVCFGGQVAISKLSV